MAKTIYIGVGGVARKVKKIYVGVSGVARKVKKAFIGVGGVARLCYTGVPDDPIYTGSYDIVTNGDYRCMYLKTSGTLTFKGDGLYDVFLVGGGASGATNANLGWGGGGGGGYTTTAKSLAVSEGAIVNVTIGAGGAKDSNAGINSGSASSAVINGNTYRAAGALATMHGATPRLSAARYRGGDGGSGGCPSTSGVIAAGYDGSGGSPTNLGGYGQGTTTRAFGEAGNALYVGGGGGKYGNDVSGPAGAGGGGSPGGGNGLANTGGGGGGNYGSDDASYAGAGGSGLVIVRWSIA